VHEHPIEYIEALDSRWETCKDNPHYFSIIDSKYIAFYPHPATTSGTFTVHYKYRAAELGDSDIVAISKHNERLLVDGIVADLLAQAEEYSKASIYFRDYANSLRQERILIENRTGPDRLFRLARQEARNHNG